MPHRRTPGSDRAGRSDLHYAAADGNVGEVQRLIAAGADVRQTDTSGWTPLHFAAQSQHTGVVRLLLSSGAEVDARDSHGNTPLSSATFSSRGAGGCIAALRAAGADPHRTNHHGVSPVDLARRIANFDVAQHFDDVTANPGAT